MSDFTVLCVNTFAAYIGVIPFMIILQIIFKKHKLPKRHQFGLYLYALPICSILMSTDTPSLYQLNFDPQFNFIPFYGVMDNLNHYMQSFFLFMPLGLLLPTLWKQFQPPKKVFLYMLLFSFLIEISQVFCFANTAVTDITDIIMNLLGSAVGYCVFLLIKNMRFMKRMHSKTNNPQRKKLARQEIYIYFFTPWLVTFLITPFISNAIWDIIWDSAIGMPL